ncbi:nucleotide pyrophosphohydrolase [Periweissella cryptocerci]|uniref:Nucleotide pyrophosphohydrolase n=1 Tax=Periweissella cryptocerci TaxID=2506420 RepID=A0A4V1AIX2_9LACO|nr:nucleoside triphosphate pyrophosphohydrolase family protein [Periweissella cryptocerci]QBO36995.1 nucleotide pyrophosphohydrolase [Periweissella cryptocerci]
MEFNEYQKDANRTLFGTETVLTNLGLGLASETGQITYMMKRYSFEGAKLDKQVLTHEIGDALWYLSQIAEWADIDFEDAAKENLASLNQRYPDGEHK